MSIPVLPGSDFCPVTPLSRILNFAPDPCDQPLFQIFVGLNLTYFHLSEVTVEKKNY